MSGRRWWPSGRRRWWPSGRRRWRGDKGLWQVYDNDIKIGDAVIPAGCRFIQIYGVAQPEDYLACGLKEQPTGAAGQGVVQDYLMQPGQTLRNIIYVRAEEFAAARNAVVWPASVQVYVDTTVYGEVTAILTCTATTPDDAAKGSS